MKCLDYINLSQDQEIICLSNLDGIQIYDIINFQLLFKLNPLRIGLKGIVSKSKIFYNSQIIAFIILESSEFSAKEQLINTINNSSERQSLVLYDMKNYEILGKITMKSSVEIRDFLITKFFIIIMIENTNKVFLFKTANLEYFKTLTNVDLGTIAYSDEYKKNKNINDKQNIINIDYKSKMNKCILAYRDYKNKRNIIRHQFIFNEDKSKVLGDRKKNLEIELNSSGIRYLGLISSFLIVSSAYGNKIHIYDLLNGRFKYCLILGNFPYDISEIHLDNKQKIFSIITNNKYLRLYKLNRLRKLCYCALHPDREISKEEERGIFEKFKHKIGYGRDDFLCRYKINYNDFDMKYNSTLIYFDKNNKKNDSIYTIQLNKNCKKLKFDRKKTKDMIVVEEITLPEYTINKEIIYNNQNIDENNNKDEKKNKINLLDDFEIIDYDTENI